MCDFDWDNLIIGLILGVCMFYIYFDYIKCKLMKPFTYIQPILIINDSSDSEEEEEEEEKKES